MYCSIGVTLTAGNWVRYLLMLLSRCNEQLECRLEDERTLVLTGALADLSPEIEAGCVTGKIYDNTGKVSVSFTITEYAAEVMRIILSQNKMVDFELHEDRTVTFSAMMLDFREYQDDGNWNTLDHFMEGRE